jgi:hypothetical protein
MAQLIEWLIDFGRSLDWLRKHSAARTRRKDESSV